MNNTNNITPIQTAALHAHVAVTHASNIASQRLRDTLTYAQQTDTGDQLLKALEHTRLDPIKNNLTLEDLTQRAHNVEIGNQADILIPAELFFNDTAAQLFPTNKEAQHFITHTLPNVIAQVEDLNTAITNAQEQLGQTNA